MPYLESKFLVNFILHGQAVAVPAEPSVDMETTLVGVPCHHILIVGLQAEVNSKLL